jgi:hypothetical protein
MYCGSTLLVATALMFAASATAAPVTSFAPGSVSRAGNTASKADEPSPILVQNRARGGGQRAAGAANRGGSFNSNNFHRDVSNTRATNAGGNRNVNAAANRNVNVNANRNVNISGGGGCCNGNYNSGPTWGGVAAGVAVGAVVGAAANSAAQSTYAAPPPTYPPGYVSPPPY